MRREVFDTNKLIRQWRQSRTLPLSSYEVADVESWAEGLIRLHRTRFILTPVYLEFIGGTVDRREMSLTKAFLKRFIILDRGDIRPQDWAKARQLAERIARDGKPRGAIDCLIKAIAIRLKCGILTDDAGMPRHP